METIGIYIRDGHQFQKIIETNNMIQFRTKIEEIISEGTRAEDIIISDGYDLHARMMEGLTNDE